MSGLFAGEVTQKVPADKALTDKKAGYMWMGYEILTIGAITLSGYQTWGNGSLTRIEVRTDGTMWKYEEYAPGIFAPEWSQISAATDWIIPNTDADSTYEFRATGVTGVPFTEKPADNDVWVPLTGNLTWGLDGENNITDFTIEVRKSGGAVITSGVYRLDVGDAA